MYKYLFHPTYSFGEGEGVREALLYQAESDLIQERFCRSVLLSMLPDSQTDLTELRVDQVANDVIDVVEHLFIDSQSGLLDLRDCVNFASQIWDTTRKNKNLYHLSFQPYHRDDPDWTIMDLSMGGEDKIRQLEAVHGVNDNVVLEAFPSVYIADKPIRQLNAGISVRRYQTLAARKELEEEFKGPIIGTIRPKPPSGRARKKSVALVGNHVVQQSTVGKIQVASNH